MITRKQLDQYRTYFSVTQQQIYLNHAATSPLSTKVTQAIGTYLDQRCQTQPDNFEKVLQTAEALRALFGQIINAVASRIAILQNTTQGLNTIASGLSWKPGDEILIPEQEFPANVYPFLNLRQKGVKVRFLPLHDGGLQPDILAGSITKRTKLLSISYVGFLSGFKHDLKTIGQICRDKHVIFVVDSIQGLGAVPLDVQACHIDALANGGHKWLMCPQGIGFLYLKQSLQAKIRPVHIGWTGLADPMDFLNYEQELAVEARRYELGSFNSLGVIGAHAALSLLTDIGIPNIYEHLIELTSRLCHGLEQVGCQLFTTEDLKNRSGIVTFIPRAKQTSEAFYNYLRAHQVVCSLREGRLRMAPHFYNTPEEVDRIIELCDTFSVT